MGIVDKVKQGAGQAMTMASQAAERAKDEAKELNLKRQISNEEQRLGSIAIRLVEREEISHAELAPSVDRIGALRAELEALQRGQESEEPSEEPGDGEREAERGAEHGAGRGSAGHVVAGSQEGQVTGEGAQAKLLGSSTGEGIPARRRVQMR